MTAGKSNERQGHGISDHQSAGTKSPEEAQSVTHRPQVQNYKPKKPKLDIKDFQFVGLKGEVRVKPPG